MRFRLVYDGPLRSSKGSHKTGNVWAIRKELHSQLAELWTIKPALQGYVESYTQWTPDEKGEFRLHGTRGREEMREQLRVPIEVRGRHYLPLVRTSLFLTCSVDILFLRKDEAGGGGIDFRGDLDNRLQTLFDGLKMPEKGDNDIEPPDLVMGATAAAPLYVLTEDDKLISNVAIRTDRLLHRPKEPRDSVVLVIDVIVSPTRVVVEQNSGFTWD